MTNTPEKFEEKSKIRHYFNEKSGEVFFSVIDTIEALGLSKDPRNYWKVLKSRLKIKNNELVTSCISIKMMSRDGKCYQTDSASSNTLLRIIQIILPEKVKSYGEYFDFINEKYRTEKEETGDLSTVEIDEGEIGIDMNKEKDFLIIKAMIAGVQPGNIFVSVNYNKLTIKGDRFEIENISDKDYYIKELFWGKFYKTIDLPFEVDIDQVEATIDRGLLVIKIPILDKGRTKIVKIKSL